VPPRTVPSPPAAPVEPLRSEVLSEVMQLRQELAARQSEIAALKADRQALRDEALATRAKIAELESAARGEDALRREQAELHSKTLTALRERVAELDGKAQHAAGLQRRLAELEETTAHMQELEFKVEEMAERLMERESLIGSLQSQLATLPPASANDDLKNIRGIGPKYEKALKALGITTYRQIAGWTEADVERIADKLSLRAERIVRDDWIGRARKLLEG
jgi:predicted flap endonuclease-1-like 5' DNA nuclease